MTAVRLIKKYPNRRLYDTEASRYITLADVRELVLRGERVRVLDASSGEDLSRSVLLQIMLEEEAGGEPLFSADMLAQIIRFYGGTMQGLFARYLEESLSMFEQQQQGLGADPMQQVTDLARRNMQLWGDMQESWFRSMGFARDPQPDRDDKD
jgi:polyhydroxyalkanoate synthesis repressor PhaR